MNCPICQGGDYWPIESAQDALVAKLRAQHGDDAHYDWRLCKRCSNAYPSHPPDRRILQTLWAQNRTDDNAGPDEREKIWSYRRAIAKTGAERSHGLFAPLVSNSRGRLLDVGCGLGETILMFTRHGWDAEGIDADPSTAPVHREIGIKTRIGQFEEVALEGRYDIIHIAHAIYFISEPMHFMRGVRQRLASNGIFCVVLADFLANPDLSLPGYVHTFFPTAHSMRHALALAGFETILSRAVSGSIYIAARPAPNPSLPVARTLTTLLLYRTKRLRYALLGAPYLALRRAVKTLLGRN